MLFFWLGTQGTNPTNLNTNNLTAVTGDSSFISKENLWNNPDNWGVHVGGMEDKFSTSWARFPVGGDIVCFQGFTGAEVDGVTVCHLPRSECLYGGISTDGNWYGDPDGTGLGYLSGGTNDDGLTAQGGQIRVSVWDGYDEHLLETGTPFHQGGGTCPWEGSTGPSICWCPYPHNGGRRARLGVAMTPDFPSTDIEPFVGDWYGLSVNAEFWSSRKAMIWREGMRDLNCRTTLGGYTYLDAISVAGGDYIEFVQTDNSAGCTIGDIYISRRDLDWDKWWNGSADTADATMTLSTVPIVHWNARTKFAITGDYIDTSEKVMSSNIIYSRTTIPSVKIYSQNRCGGPEVIPLGMVKVPYSFAADIADIEIAPQERDTQTIGDNVLGWEETPNTSTMFNPRWFIQGECTGTCDNGDDTTFGGLSLGNLTTLESYGPRAGTKHNNSVILVPQFQGTGDGYINNLESYSGWILPMVDNTSPTSHLIISEGKIGSNDTVLQTYDRAQHWNGFEIQGHTGGFSGGVDQGIPNTGQGLLCLGTAPDIRFKYGTRLSIAQIDDDEKISKFSGFAGGDR